MKTEWDKTGCYTVIFQFKVDSLILSERYHSSSILRENAEQVIRLTCWIPIIYGPVHQTCTYENFQRTRKQHYFLSCCFQVTQKQDEIAYSRTPSGASLNKLIIDR